MTDTHLANIQARWAALAKFAAGMAGQPARIHLDPMPSDFRAVADDLRLLADNIDPLIAEYGAYVSANVSGHFDERLFKDQLSGALDGNALYEIEDAAERLAEDIAEAVA